MSSSKTRQRSSSPIDQDLQQLYEQVWAGFATEEPPPSTEKDIDTIYSVYGEVNDRDYPARMPTPQTQKRTASPLPPSNGRRYGDDPSNSFNLPVPSAYSHKSSPSPSPVQGNGSIRRPLPTPGTSPSFSMPEPEVYDTRPSQGHRHSESSGDPRHDSYSSSNGDLLRKATGNRSSSNRRLPEPPRGAGLPASPRPSTASSRNEPVWEPVYDSPTGYEPAYDTLRSYGSPSQTRRPTSPPDPHHHHSSHQSLDVPGPTIHRKPSRDHIQDQYYNASSQPRYDPYPSSSSSSQVEPGPSFMPLPESSSSGYFDKHQHRNIAVNGTTSQDYQITPSSSSSVPIPLVTAPAPPKVYYVPHPEPISPSDQYYDDGPGNVMRRPSEMLRDIANYSHSQEYDEADGEYWEDEEEGEENFVNFSLLSHLAVQLKDKVPRGTHVKGSIPYPRAFTGKDIVSTIQSLIQRELAINLRMSTNDRRAALQVARSLQSQLYFYEVEWGGRVLQDGVEDVFMFLDDREGASDAPPVSEELPTGVVTMLTKCYVATCVDESPCYSYSCPRRGTSILGPVHAPVEQPAPEQKPDWPSTVPKEVLDSLPESEINRQTIIHKIINKEDQYLADLDTVENDFIRPLRRADPPLIEPVSKLEDFIDAVFGNILDLRECNRRLLEVMYVRQREQQYVIQRIGDVFLEAATVDFRLAYPIYIGNYPLAEKRLKEEEESNPDLRRFFEQCARHTSREGEENIYLNLKHFLNRPSEHLQKYPVFLEAIFHETAHGNPDGDYLLQAIEAIKNLQSAAQLRTFQIAMGKGAPGKWEWHDMVSADVRKSLSKEDAKRQAIIFELIKGEMAYVKDLENIEIMYIQPLRNADTPIIEPSKLNTFIDDVFHNFKELGVHHRRLVEKFHEIQRDEHPIIRSVTAPMFDAALHFRDAYMEYIPNYPIAAYRIDNEMATNPAFKEFVEKCVRHPDAHRLDMKNFINRPIPRLLRYELLLKGVLDETPPGHDDRRDIPQVLEVIKSIGKDTEPGVVSAKQKVELWRYSSYLIFKHGETVDMDLLDQNRSLIHSGKLLRQPDSGLEWNGWSELFVLLFDNYLVLTKPKEKDGVTYYYVNRRPTPLDLLTLVNFSDPPTQRSAGLLRGLRGDRHTEGPNGNPGVSSPESSTDSRAVYPCTLHHNGRMGGPYILYAETAQARAEWKQKLEEALVIRKVVQESNKVFEIETLSADTFLIPSMLGGGPASPPAAWNQENSLTGKVTCSVPFNTADGRWLVAIGCAEGVWIGFRHDPKSMRRVLHLKLVTQCAMLEEFGLFLVLADKSLFAYHIEALVPSSPTVSHASQVPQKLSGAKDVHFFSIGTLHGRTLVVYMKKKGLESIFRVLEPVGDKINERVKAPGGFGSRLGFKSAKSEWFRIYRDFFLPSESFDLIFLKANIAILCAKGFEIMNLNEFKSVTIPRIPDDAKYASLAKRCDSCRPIGMFRSAEDEFLLCYDEFGLFVDKHGDPNRATTAVEWEGTADRVALHMPYILLFDSRFIEVRRLETGRLVQIIPGNDVRCIWDGRGVNLNSPITGVGVDDEDMVQDAQVHAVMNAAGGEGGGGGGRRAVAQHVFELLPTVPLFNPGAMNNAGGGGGGGGGQGGYSPPESPHLRASMSWRS